MPKTFKELSHIKSMGFSDDKIAELTKTTASEVKKQRNRYQHKTARTAMKKFFEITKKKEAEKELPLLVSMIDKLAKNNIIHDNKAANLKANFAKHASGLKK